jgi:hypothetical protein
MIYVSGWKSAPSAGGGKINVDITIGMAIIDVTAGKAVRGPSADGEPGSAPLISEPMLFMNELIVLLCRHIMVGKCPDISGARYSSCMT